KVLFPDDAITKDDLVRYYGTVAKAMVPHLRGRPVMMDRYPDGIDGDSFVQKNVPDYFPDWIRRAEVPKENGTVTHVVCDNPATLVYLAAQTCVTPHVWLSRADRGDHPDRLIFDLDPSTDDVEVLRDTARSLRGALEDLGLTPFIQTTGSRGFHVLVPLDRRAGFDEVRSFARGVAELVAERDPTRLTTEQRKDKRGDRLYLDTMRNAYSQTSVAPYAVRARSGAPVATPLTWEELEKGDVTPRSYDTRSVLVRLEGEGDPWTGMNRHAQSLQRPMKKLARARR
ncbi:MAG: non-homologous end-joining DNA ligase, partial [Acidimicrobiales bacterium]|nr:non-homologous end-joining DNA ligase [Acidimicrobiales bacterium]